MNTVPKWIKTGSSVFIVLAPILSLLYVAPEFMRPFIPLSIFLAIKQAFPLVICVSFILFLAAILFANIKPVFKVIFITFMSMLFCISVGGVFDRKSGISSTEVLLNAVEFGNNRYNLVEIVPLGDPNTPCYLYKCDLNDLGCREISSYRGNCANRFNSDLVVNPATNEVNVLMDYGWSNGFMLVFTDGQQPRSYDYRLEVADYDYYLAYFHDYDTVQTPFRYSLYQCKKDTIDCLRLPFSYETHNLHSGYLEFDENGKTVKVIIDKELIYTYGDSPKCYVDGCFLIDK